MTPPPSLMRALMEAPILRWPCQRRLLFAVLIVLCAILAWFPERYRAAVSLTPTDPTSLGLSGTLGQLGAVGNVFGNQTAIEVSLKVARSQYVREIVIKRLKLDRRLGRTPLATDRWLDREVDIRALRGGIIEFEADLHDPALARDVVAAYGDAVREQLAVISRTQTTYKRNILVELVDQASDRLAKAQAAYDAFRLQTRYSSPQMAIAAVGDRIPQLEMTIRGREVELNAARQFGTEQNMRVRQIEAEIDALQRQLDLARSTSVAETSSVGRVVQESTRADRLRRELDLAQGLYDNYKRYLLGTSVEDLTSTANIRILEPAYIDTERQLNYVPIMLGVLLILSAAAMEMYAFRPPLDYRQPV